MFEIKNVEKVQVQNQKQSLMQKQNKETLGEVHNSETSQSQDCVENGAYMLVSNCAQVSVKSGS